ncbi:MAG TPA: ATP-binding protein [Candidatus Limnocylindria bacterium]|jgi:signal transduction histidine kinase/AmiR/NasT family two-component response regulator|nr:ATP-binding protein [Candidatus Limnocylindria bacterium]
MNALHPSPQHRAEELDRISWTSLIGHQECVPSSMPVAEVNRRFETTGKAFLGIVENGVLVALASRTRLGQLLGSQYGYSLYSRKPILAVAAGSPFFIKLETPLLTVLKQAMDRNEATFYDDVPLVDGERRYLGMVLVPSLVHLQNRLLTEKIALLEKSQDELAQRNVALVELTDRLNQSNDDLGRARDAALSAAKAKSTFLANVSHEIRTPMNGVIGFLNLLVETPLTTEQHEYAQTARDSAESLLDLINELLDLSKIEAGRLDLEEHPCDLHRLLRDLVKAHAVRAAQQGIELALDMKLFPPGSVRLDPNRFRQVLTNLVGNAIKFTPRGSVKIHLALLAQADGQSIIHIEVSDTGIGISPEVVTRLFVPFSQADVSTTRRFGGTGLGLAISKQLVELMGGTIGVRSELKCGSVFSVTLPYHPEQVPLPSPASSLLGTIAGLRFRHEILVAEDNAINRLLAERLLRGIGCQVDSVVNGEEAVSALKTKSYDVVFMDCQMPVMDGYEAAQKVREWEAEQGATRRTPIYALTASAMPEERDQCVASGMDGCLAKPIKRELIESVLHRVTRLSATDTSVECAVSD